MKVSELTGALLDYWVAKALGHKVIMFDGAPKVLDWQKPGSIVRGNPFMPSSHWAHGGPIIECESIELAVACYANEGDKTAKAWQARKEIADGDDWRSIYAVGTTPLIAAMHAYVASKYGDEVPDEVPK